MKKFYICLVRLIIVNYFTLSQISGQQILMDPSGIRPIHCEHHGLSMVNFFNTCTDSVCMENVKKLQPRVVRFPSAGDAAFYSMDIDTPGYGVDFKAVASYLAERNHALHDPLTYPPLTSTYTCPDIIDSLGVPLVYNASVPNVFANADDAANFQEQLEDWYCVYRKQKTQIEESYLLKFIRYIKEIEDGLPAGERVNVIYVANIFSGTPAGLVNTLRQLTDGSINGIKSIHVAGIELSNESWGKVNNTIFQDPHAGQQFYYYVRGMQSPTTYTGPLVVNGDFISAIRANFPDIKIGFPAAPMASASHSDYYGCPISSGSESRFNAWNSELATLINSPITIDSLPTTVSSGDAFVIHKYFDDKYWALKNVESIGGTCTNCLFNPTGEKKYKNFLQDLADAGTDFNQPYSYYPESADDSLSLSFDCQMQQTLKFIDSGFVDKVLDGYRELLGINNTNQKKIWMTEWNILEDNRDDTTTLYHNTFNQAVLLLGWKMAMYRSNWELPDVHDMFQYSTFYNGVAVNQNGCLSPRSATREFGDGMTIDAGSTNVRRMAYWPTYLTRHISIDALNWIDNESDHFTTFPDVRFYTFINPAQDKLYVYYLNAGDSSISLNLDSVLLNGFVNDSLITHEYFTVKNNYSTAGIATQFENNKYYKVGKNWKTSIENEPASTYTSTIENIKTLSILRKSMGVYTIPISKATSSVSGIDVADENIQIFPNPTSGRFTIRSGSTLEDAQVQILSVVGQVILATHVSGTRADFDLSTLPSGVYFLTICRKNKSITNHKIIIAH